VDPGPGLDVMKKRKIAFTLTGIKLRLINRLNSTVPMPVKQANELKQKLAVNKLSDSAHFLKLNKMYLLFPNIAFYNCVYKILLSYKSL
jgi:hypothetical protein